MVLYDRLSLVQFSISVLVLRLMLVGVWLGLHWALFYFFDHYIISWQSLRLQTVPGNGACLRHCPSEGQCLRAVAFGAAVAKGDLLFRRRCFRRSVLSAAIKSIKSYQQPHPGPDSNARYKLAMPARRPCPSPLQRAGGVSGYYGRAAGSSRALTGQLSTGLHTQCGVNFFILDSRRVLAPAPKVLESDSKTHLKSRFCLQAILKKRGRILD